MADKNFKVKTGLSLPQPLPADQGGTGQTSLANSLNAMLPSQAGNSAKILSTDGTNPTWIAQSVAYQRGGTASRPGSPSVGDLYYNTDNNYFESYTSNGWFPIAAAPGIPTSVTATNQGSSRAYNNGQMSVAFNVATNAGAPSSFIVTPTPTTSPSTFTGSSSPVAVTGLASSTQYTYTVQATSPYGTSSASSASTGVTATTVPQAPTINSVTGGAASASVAFTANATGGSSITGYTVTSSPGNITASGSSSPITVSGLTDGTAYTFTMTATNANGTSAASSASSSVTPQSWSPDGAYDALATITVPAGGVSSVTFNGIPTGYKHLQIRSTVLLQTTNEALLMRSNNDTGNNYFSHYLYGTGSGSALATNSVPASYYYLNSGIDSTYPGPSITDILDYGSSNKNKVIRSFGGNDKNGGNSYIWLFSGAWNNTSPITSLTIYAGNGNINQYSQVSLYGVK